MNQVFFTSFGRDIKKIRNKSVAKSVQDFIEMTSKCILVSEIPGLVKLKGHKTAYRVRIQHYRLGLFIALNS
jgi:mRNA-degrading endonuclease RelE of RelBE toxin-antitoxin system